MKLDNEHVYQNSSLVVHKQDSKPVEYDMDMDIDMDFNELKSGNGIVVKEKHDLWDNDNNNKKMDLFEKDSIYYTDKSVIECELPELMVCYKDSRFNVVKDILIDEGVVVSMEIDPTDSKLMKRNKKEDDDTVVNVTSTDIIDMVGRHDVLSSSSTECWSEEGIATLSGCSESLLVVENVKTGSIDGSIDGSIESSGNTVNEVYVERDVVSLAKLKMETLCIGNDELQEVSSDQRSSENEILESSVVTVVERNSNEPEACVARNDNQGANSVGPVLISTGVEQQTNLAVSSTKDSSSLAAIIDSAYNSKVESANIMFDFDSRKLVHQSLVSEHQVSSHPRDCMGEASFSSVGPSVSGLITYSGPIAYSGNLSIRSDSSTTSTRSFAFPVLMNEWSSSPVRMVKAERRHQRKSRGWLRRVICCTF